MKLVLTFIAALAGAFMGCWAFTILMVEDDGHGKRA